MPAPQPHKKYHSYLLRLKRVAIQPPVWHASLQDVRTGEWHQFMSLAQLFAFIEQTAEGNNRSPSRESQEP